MGYRLWFLVLALALLLGACGALRSPTAPAALRETAQPSPTSPPQVFGPFFDSTAPPDDACQQQMASWEDDAGEWVVGPRYCTYWPSDEAQAEAVSLCVGQWQDVTVEANLRYYTLPSRAGILVRALHSNDALVFVISGEDGGTCYWQMRRGAADDPVGDPERWGEPIDPMALALPLGSGSEVVLAGVRIEAMGNRLVAYVNGLEASVFEGAPVRTGRVGLYMHNDGTEQAWADVVIRAR